MIPLNKLLSNMSKHAEDENYVFSRLYEKLYNPEFYYKALAKLYPNKGAGTPGTDESDTIDGFSKESIDRIIETIRDQSYQPKPVKRVYIPKKNGKKRPLGLPGFTDKVIQEVIRVILDTIYEPLFSDHSHGFRENRSCHTCLQEIQRTFTGVSWFIEGDIKGAFDNIDHEILVNILKKRIKDDRFINLIRKFLNAGYLEDWTYHKTYSGAPQGSIISPILCNIYLTKLDNYALNELKLEFDKGTRYCRERNPEYTKCDYKMQKAKKKIAQAKSEEEKQQYIKNYQEARDRKFSLSKYLPNAGEYRRLQYVRYADDFLIGVIGSKEDCRQIKERIGNFLKDSLKLDMSPEKTLITHSDKSARFLGYDVVVRRDNSISKDRNGIKQRRHNRKVVLKIPKGFLVNTVKEKKLVKDLSTKHWMPIHRSELLNSSDLEILMIYNSELRGWYNYHSLAENVSTVMDKLAYIMEYSCLKTLANKHRTTVGKYRKAHATKEKRWGIAYETKSGRRTMEFYKGFERKKPCRDGKVDQKPNNAIYTNSRTELESRLRADRCELCGKEGPVEIHHMNKIKNLKGKSRWEKIMIAKKRKTLMVCHDCHKKIHNGSL